MQHFIFIAVVSLFSYAQAQAQCSYYMTAYSDDYRFLPAEYRFEFDPGPIDTYLTTWIGTDFYVAGLIQESTSDLYIPANDGIFYWDSSLGDTFQISVSDGENYYLLTDNNQNNIYGNNYIPGPGPLQEAVIDQNCVTAVFCDTFGISECSSGALIADASTTKCTGADGCDADTCCLPKTYCDTFGISECSSGALIADASTTECTGADGCDADTCCDGEAFFAGREDFTNLLPTFKKLFNAGGGC